MLDKLPDTVLGKIISFLHWYEKYILAQTRVSARVRRVLHSSLGWGHFDNTRKCVALFKTGPWNRVTKLEEYMIRTFGKYFQHCKLWLRLADLRDDNVNENDVNMLQLVSEHCKQLKSMCIVHPSQLTYTQMASCYTSYLIPLLKIISNRNRGCSLSMKGLFYSPLNEAPLVSEMENYVGFLVRYNMESALTCLDALCGLRHASLLNNGGPVVGLAFFLNLHTLKCPVQAVSARIIIHLAKSSLVQLFLVSDDSTSGLSFSENDEIDWRLIYMKVPVRRRGQFQVHYIYQNKVLHTSDLPFNPFTRSLVFDNLLNNIPIAFLHTIINIYGSSLNTLAFCNHYWDFSMYFADLKNMDQTFGQLGRRCSKLKLFVSCLEISSSALLQLVGESESLVQLHVRRDRVGLLSNESVDSLQQAISDRLGSPCWEMCDWETDIFDGPGLDPLLFSSCEAYSL